MLALMPHGTRPRRLATYDDLLRAPDHLVAEIVDGELYTSPRPAPRHASAATTLVGDLEPAFARGRGGPGGWTILMEPELHLGPDILVPDIAGWRRERLPRLPDEAWFRLAPDWVCEVVSPSTLRLDRLKKLRVYARERVPDVWLVDPLERFVEALHLEGGRWSITGTHGGNEVVRLAPFAGIELQLAGLWPPDEA
jgi:Uma2 family endonuclease